MFSFVSFLCAKEKKGVAKETKRKNQGNERRTLELKLINKGTF
jgi:hypothetical protein